MSNLMTVIGLVAAWVVAMSFTVTAEHSKDNVEYRQSVEKG